MPEIIDPRHTRKMPIRDPEYIKKAMKEKNNAEKENQELIDHNQIPDQSSKVYIQEFGELSHDETVSLPKRRKTSVRKLNFNEF